MHFYTMHKYTYIFSPWILLWGLENKVTPVAMSTLSTQAFLVSNTIPHHNKPRLIKEEVDSRAWNIL